MWQTIYYIIGSACTVALTGYGITSLFLEKRKRNSAQCEACKFCETVYDYGGMQCNKCGYISNRPKYCGYFSRKDVKSESN